MKIAFVMGSLNPGGGEKQAVKIIRELIKRGHEVTLILPNGGGNMPGNLYPQVQGVAKVELGHSTDKVGAITAALRNINPDVVHSNGYPATLWGTLAAYQAGVPSRVINLVDMGFVRQEFPQHEDFERSAHEAATVFVGNCQAVVDSFEQYPGLDRDKARVIFNGVDTPPLTATQPREQGGESSEIVIGMLANFRPDGIKNQAMFVQAARERILHFDEKPLRFVMHGYHSTYTDEIRALIDQLGVDKWVHIGEQITDLSALAGWNIAVNCSKTEGLSNAIQECMAYGLPVVATRAGGNSELVIDGKTGYLVDSDDDKAMAERIGDLVHNVPLRKRMGRAARKSVEERFSWDAIMPQWEAVYTPHPTLSPLQWGEETKGGEQQFSEGNDD